MNQAAVQSATNGKAVIANSNTLRMRLGSR